MSESILAGETRKVIVHDPEGSHEGLLERSKTGVLSGETSVRYRLVLELDPPAKRQKKLGGSSDLDRMELFFNDPTIFYWLQVFLSRANKGTGKKPWTRLEAVILDEGSSVTWSDRNPDERV